MKKISSLLAKIALFSFVILAVAPVLVPAISSEALAEEYGGSSNYASSSQLNSNVLVDVMCNVLRIITGNAGKAFAAFAILSVGIGFFTGKVSWGLMIGVAAGIAAMFGAPTIVAAITGTSTFSCANT
jgi:type IV secretion system protein VirB2